MKKKLFLLLIILYLLGGVWFYFKLRNANAMVEICPQNIIESSPELCEPQKFTIQEELMGALHTFVFWVPMIVGTGLGR